jgi:hypothetical protein
VFDESIMKTSSMPRLEDNTLSSSLPKCREEVRILMWSYRPQQAIHGMDLMIIFSILKLRVMNPILYDRFQKLLTNAKRPIV